MGVSDTRGMNTKHHRRPNHECFSSIRTGVLDTLVNQFSLPCVALIAIQHLEAGLREIFVNEEIPDGNYVFYDLDRPPRCRKHQHRKIST